MSREATVSHSALKELMAHCFHQDMDLEAETIPEAISLFARHLDGQRKQSIMREIAALLAEERLRWDASPFNFSDIDLEEFGLSPADFLRMVQDILVDPDRFREFVPGDFKEPFPHLRRLVRACLDLPMVSAEARAAGVVGADSIRHALILAIEHSSPAEQQALIDEVQRFRSTYGERAGEVFSSRWFDPAAAGFVSLDAFFETALSGSGGALSP